MTKITERTLGEALAMSIGTAVPLEKLLKLTEHNQTHLYMNVRTLMRNFLESYVDGFKPFKAMDLTYEFIKELDTIEGLFSDSFELVFYFTDSLRIPKTFTFAKVKQPRTVKQQDYFAMEQEFYRYLMDSSWEDKIVHYKLKIRGERTNALMITSYPLDLVSRHEFENLILLESHTGERRVWTEWMRKVHKDPIWHNVPFNVMFILVLGDRSNQFSSMGAKVYKPLLKISQDNLWKPYTSVAKMKNDIKKMPDRFLADHLLEMLRSKLP